MCRALGRISRVLALDTDVLSAGAGAVEGDRRDYAGFWRYLLSLAREIQSNGMPVVDCGICRPEQVLCGPGVACFSGVHFLALVCEERELRSRILTRPGGERTAARVDVHVEVNAALTSAEVEGPHSMTVVDTTGRSAEYTIQAAQRWVDQMVGATT